MGAKHVFVGRLIWIFIAGPLLCTGLSSNSKMQPSQSSSSEPPQASGSKRLSPDIPQVVVPIHHCYGLPTYPSTSLKRSADYVQGFLANAPAIGIIGMGGIGKTTLAKEVFNNISMQFEYTCFVNNVKGIPEHELEDWVLRRFHRNGTKVDGNRIQWSDLIKTKTLIVLDDVNSETQIRNLPSLDHFGSDSRLMVTTRDRGVLNASSKYAIYEVNFLNLEEAKELFCRHAFDQEGIPDGLLEQNPHLGKNVNDVVQHCGGLPLTLEVMGSYLKDHKSDARAWRQTLEKLRKGQSITGVQNDRLWASLRMSYDALSPEEQRMFIEAATYFYEQPIWRALEAWSSAYGNVETRWANLLRTSMVKELHTREQNWAGSTDDVCKVVWVQQQLRDLATNLFKTATISRSGRTDHSLSKGWTEEARTDP